MLLDSLRDVMKLWRLLLAAILASLAVDLRASQRPNQSNQTPEQLTVAAQRPLRLTIPVWVEPPPKRIGVFTVVPPERRGEMIQLSTPLGDLTMRAVRAVGQTQYRRAEQKARKEVSQALEDFQATQRSR
jgi:hypothetical protein